MIISWTGFRLNNVQICQSFFLTKRCACYTGSSYGVVQMLCVKHYVLNKSFWRIYFGSSYGVMQMLCVKHYFLNKSLWRIYFGSSYGVMQMYCVKHYFLNKSFWRIYFGSSYGVMQMLCVKHYVLNKVFCVSILALVTVLSTSPLPVVNSCCSDSASSAAHY